MKTNQDQVEPEEVIEVVEPIVKNEDFNDHQVPSNSPPSSLLQLLHSLKYAIIIWTNRIYLIAIHTHTKAFFSCERVCNNCAIFFLASRF